MTLYNRASEYAVRGLVHLAKRPYGEFVALQDIARQEKLPLYFLSNIFQRLAKEGMLRSRQGMGGGFQLRRDPRRIRLLDIVDALERSPCYKRCAMGYAECSNRYPCPMHKSWKGVRRLIRDSLQRQTISDMAAQRPRSRRVPHR